MRIFLLGYPGHVGGACTECWHTVKLWREAGWDVHLVPTWGRDQQWEAKLDALGCVTHHVDRSRLATVPSLAGATVVGMCNHHFLTSVPELRRLGCRLVWVNCMTFIFPAEHKIYQQHGTADAHVFQSQFQRDMLEPELLAKHDYRIAQGHLVHGAFDSTEFPFGPRPHGPGEPYVIGRLARPDLDKWSSNTWPIYRAVPYAQRKALVMGWDERLGGKLGPSPDWATCLRPNEISAQEFLGRCHVLMPVNGGARENWPRIGLEAMSAGVPIVTQNKWGWPEMVRHGETGYLANNDEELAYYAAALAYNEPRRLEMAEAARAHCRCLVDPEKITASWREVFEAI